MTALRKTAAATVAAAAVLACAAPAVAAPADSAYAIAAGGLLTIPKTPSVSGSGSESLATVALPTSGPALVKARALNADVSAGHAKASVAGLALDLGLLPNAPVDLGLVPDVAASVITAECKNGKGSVSIAGLKVGDRTIKLDKISPNTTIPLAPVLELVLNKQTRSGDSLSVTAVSVKLLGKTQTLDIASATCGKGGTEPSKPTTTTSKPDDGDKPGPGGKAPRPTPRPGHLDVTG
ncbi:choice-of-anchor P family protein [Amycolatopsis suaedae]|uniref:Cholesterol esterase n=1 Tax=Amycolatopsis suaedae TaxID=2510978 RepID=A0A4Q7J014_9PSEU|nr:choice-of-anchor P family protein [Amycolatopsis suaedae]RZQ59254.1 hypothetical protein EWH70_35290 [Amycolatopsis suaedae]